MLTRAILSEGCKSVAAGMNPMDLRRGINLAVDHVVKVCGGGEEGRGRDASGMNPMDLRRGIYLAVDHVVKVCGGGGERRKGGGWTCAAASTLPLTTLSRFV